MTRQQYNDRLVNDQLTLHQSKQKLIIEIISILAHHKSWKDNHGNTIAIKDYLYVTFSYKSNLEQFKIDLFIFTLDQLQEVYYKLVIQPNYYL